MKTLNVANRWNADLIDSYYEKWIEDARQVTPDWRAFFEGFELGRSGKGGSVKAVDEEALSVDSKKQACVIGAIYAYRSLGHTIAKINPLKEPQDNPRLSLNRLGFNEADLDSPYHTGNYLGGVIMSVRELLDRLKKTYCGSVGVEYLHIQETPKRRWLQKRMEPSCNIPKYSQDKKIRILRKIIEAETFEHFLHNRFVGQKRFSLEGAETLIACLDAIIERCPKVGTEEVVMGMAHRGRLNVLANILGKSSEFICREFSENFIKGSVHGGGDVKYHLGYSNTATTESGHEIDVRLVANPSHLEAVDSVVEGCARARQRLLNDSERKRVLPLLIHGDAAFSGQGVVTEVFNLSKLKGYRTGGTIHIVVNNQIGFTTDPCDARSSQYCTDVAKIVEAPIFHVNGDDPLAVLMAAEIALDYRKEYGEDVVIDMYCYRKHGHNEADEPKFTHPLLYEKIAQHPCISVQLSRHLIEEGVVKEEEVSALKSTYQAALDKAFDDAKGQESVAEKQNGKAKRRRRFEGSTAEFQPPYDFKAIKTGIAAKQLEAVARKLTQAPKGLKLNPKIERQLEARSKAFKDDKGIDWAFAEALAFGTLLIEGTPVRLSGQDSERGTFSQRHSVLHEMGGDRSYIPLLHLSKDQAEFCVHNSLLSEAAVLGFDFGYSLDHPQMLCIWEAQFGDFANGAQTIIDQFIVPSEMKWQRISSLVMLLPHGYEGQGPEHSSARLERFLQACAEDNIQVCNLTTPAQYYHVLRRQMRRTFRKPLVIMSPKSLLRHKHCISHRSDFAGSFQCLLDDVESPARPKRLILCSGKVYYDLLEYRTTQKIKDAALVRIEQLYPLDIEGMKRLLKKYAKVEKIIWCQEEPKNMGAWSYLSLAFADFAENTHLHYAGRSATASPAVGSLSRHLKQQQALVEDAFTSDLF